MKSKLITLLLILLSTSMSYAQALTEMAANEMKYWKLRGRFLGDQNNRDVYNGFVRIGTGTGMSIPAEIRGPIYGHHWQFNINPNSLDPNFTEGGCANLGMWPLPGNYVDPRDNQNYKCVSSPRRLYLCSNYILNRLCLVEISSM